MNRDWMAIGRRPSGLCGAALLVSARMYDFHLTLDDIVKVVKIGKTTLRKRMLEFEDTPSSNLTVDEFHTIDLEEEHDPPAYTRSRKFAKMKQIEEMVNIQEIEKEIMQLQENIEAALNELQKPRGLMAKYAKFAQLESEILGPNKDPTNVDSEIKEAEEFLSEEQINIIRSIVSDNEIGQLPGTSGLQSATVAGKDDDDSEKWNNLKPTLRTLGLVREPTIHEESHSSDDDDDDDEDDDLDDDDDGLSDFSDIDDEMGENDDNDDDALDLEAIHKRRKRYRKLKRLRKKMKLMERELPQPLPSTDTTEKSNLVEEIIVTSDSHEPSEKAKETTQSTESK